jgi:hypothetical protein
MSGGTQVMSPGSISIDSPLQSKTANPSRIRTASASSIAEDGLVQMDHLALAVDVGSVHCDSSPGRQPLSRGA